MLLVQQLLVCGFLFAGGQIVWMQSCGPDSGRSQVLQLHVQLVATSNFASQVRYRIHGVNPVDLRAVLSACSQAMLVAGSKMVVAIIATRLVAGYVPSVPWTSGQSLT